jgi:isocitrate/isopropylmalate dehydrogenase
MVDIAVIPGDGIGKEIIPGVCEMLSEIEPSINFNYFDISSERYLNKGITITDREISDLKGYKSIFFGAIGDFRVKPGIMEQGVILRLRRELDLYMNIRPARSFNKISGNNINIVILRENMEDFYSNISGSFNENKNFKKNNNLYNFNMDINSKSNNRIYYTLGFLSENNLNRFFSMAYNIAKSDNITVTDKANAVSMYSIWREMADAHAREMNVKIAFEYADSLAYNMIKNPLKYRYIIAPNLYGDILSDMASAMAGGLGYAPSGNIGDYNSMFEPVHGSAPDIAGKNIANPVASILSASMMLDHLNMKGQAKIIENALESVINNGIIPVESGGNAGTKEFINIVKNKCIMIKDEI